MESNGLKNKDKKLFLITTETSGDLLAARLINRLKEKSPHLQVWGAGGPKSIQAGLNAFYTVKDFNVMGLVEVLGKLSQLKRQFNDLVQICREMKPEAIVLIDAPDFNIRMARALKPLGVPILYYVSPQVWAWRKGRARQIAELVDHMMVLFEFEVPIYEQLGLKTTWVGHPLVDEIREFSEGHFSNEDASRNDGQNVIMLAPGSRPSEIKRHIPVFKGIVEKAPDGFCFKIPLAPGLKKDVLESLANHPKVEISTCTMRKAAIDAKGAVVVSGTATLETALLGVPMVVGYRMNPLSYRLARLLVKVDHIALANIVLGRGVVPELLQDEFEPVRIWNELNRLCTEGEERDQMMRAFSEVPERLGGGGAAKKAATVVEAYL